MEHLVSDRTRSAVDGRYVWSGADLMANKDWIYRLEESHLSEIDEALSAVRDVPVEKITRANFIIPETATMLAKVAAELENGRGIALLRGLPVGDYPIEEVSKMYYGLSLYIGTPVYQNRDGKIIDTIRDLRQDPNWHLGNETGLKSALNKAFSADALNFHTDTTDVIGLLCVQNASVGGSSKVASTAKGYNEILKRRPDLAEVLFSDWSHYLPEILGERTFRMPVFGIEDGKFTSSFSPANLRKGQELPGTPPLTSAQQEVLDLLLQILEENCIHTRLEAGDAQFLNNHVVSHGRTSFENSSGQGMSRIMVRVWLATPRNRKLPQAFEIVWGDVRSDVLRGGVELASGKRSALFA